ncbi:MAG: arylsulfatase [Planctomycetota bacterium]|nr:arylsulfatase [Planctomycetota bacterium]
MRQLLIVLISLAFVTCSKPQPDTAPNILFILADDLGYGDVGCFGQQHIKTPNIDKLATQGMKLTRHYSGSPVCAPSRCVLLTGKHTGNSYIRDNDEMNERGDVWNDPALEGQRPLAQSEITMGELFQGAGYNTSFIGKWGLGWTGTEGDPNAQGFDHFFGYICQRVAHNYYPDHLHRNQQTININPDGSEVDYSADLMATEALDFLDKTNGQPFMMVYATPVPHLALQVPQDSLDEYKDAFEETPYDGSKGYRPHETPRAAYAAMITRMDRDIGDILDKLDEMGVADNTLVVFTSDNGPSWIGGCDLEFFQSQGGLRGRKAQVYEGGLRVPTIVRWPGKVSANSESNYVSAFWDWLPTFCNAANIEHQQLDGHSLVKVLEGAQDVRRPDALYFEHARQAQAIIDGDFKLLRSKQSAAWELYNLREDSAETNNLAEQDQGKVVELLELVDNARVKSEIFPLKVELETSK